MKLPRDKHEWSESEDVILERGFRGGSGVAELSHRHLRSELSVKERLIFLGWMQDDVSEDGDYDINEQFPRAVDNTNNIDLNGGCDPEDDERTDEEWLADISGKQIDPDEPTSIRQDWGDVIDDLESSDWESYLGGHEDDSFD